jgi:leucyl/phenylalanyl-tRNA--protein transferase
MIPLLASDPRSPFPPIEQALDRPRGLLAAGGDLTPRRLINAYRNGIFPWYNPGDPILWWAPFPRCVLFPADVHVARRLRRQYNQGRFDLTLDADFGGVIRGCAAPRADDAGTWITPEMQTAYTRLHERGFAHSLEVWQDGELAGGIYGLALGRMFFGESMFSGVSNASKIALVALCRHLQHCGFTLLDCQVENPHLLSMGCISMSRAEFLRHLEGVDACPCWQRELHCGVSW